MLAAADPDGSHEVICTHFSNGTRKFPTVVLMAHITVSSIHHAADDPAASTQDHCRQAREAHHQCADLMRTSGASSSALTDMFSFCVSFSDSLMLPLL